MRRITLVSLVAAALMALPLGALAGVSGPAFYVDGDQYRTVGTPTNFSNTGAPNHSFDTVYQFLGAQALNVATAAPGDSGYNGGRWKVQVVGYAPGESYASALAAFDANDSGDFDWAAEVEGAIDAGVIVLSPGPWFECPVIPMPARGS
jgi:hypothetical protein